jgi:hypothetical protein
VIALQRAAHAGTGCIIECPFSPQPWSCVSIIVTSILKVVVGVKTYDLGSEYENTVAAVFALSLLYTKDRTTTIRLLTFTIDILEDEGTWKSKKVK